tara:strand:+ start:885 stop:1160 length:276 start_codon:yes stop_codon:yes gene_type:complete
MEIKTKDEIVRKVLEKMDKRSLIGQRKYGGTMEEEIERREKGLYHFMEDVQEEMMDALLYLEAAKYCLRDEIQYVADLMNKNKRKNRAKKD